MTDSEGAKVVEVDTEGSTELPRQVAVHHCFHFLYLYIVYILFILCIFSYFQDLTRWYIIIFIFYIYILFVFCIFSYFSRPHQVAVHHCFHKDCTFKQIMILAARWKRAPTGHLFLVESESGCDASTKKFPKYTYILLVFKMKK